MHYHSAKDYHCCHKHKHNLQSDKGSGSGSGGAAGVSTGLGLSESLIMYTTLKINTNVFHKAVKKKRASKG